MDLRTAYIWLPRVAVWQRSSGRLQGLYIRSSVSGEAPSKCAPNSLVQPVRSVLLTCAHNGNLRTCASHATERTSHARRRSGSSGGLMSVDLQVMQRISLQLPAYNSGWRCLATTMGRGLGAESLPCPSRGQYGVVKHLLPDLLTLSSEQRRVF